MQKIGDTDEKHGLCMAVQLYCKENHLYVLVGYEDGSVALWTSSLYEQASLVWKVKEHTAPGTLSSLALIKTELSLFSTSFTCRSYYVLCHFDKRR